jgi:hypothetical protein
MERPLDQAAVQREGGDGNRRRRDRHRRGDRGERREGTEAPAVGPHADDSEKPAMPESHASAVAPAHVDRPDIAPAMIPVPPEQAVEPTRATAPVETERVVAPVAAPAPVAPEPIVKPRPAAPPPRPVEALPPVSMTLPADSGLELVETRSKAMPMPEPEPAPAGPRRVRPPRVIIPDEPLQIVETHKEGQPPAG